MDGCADPRGTAAALPTSVRRRCSTLRQAATSAIAGGGRPGIGGAAAFAVWRSGERAPRAERPDDHRGPAVRESERRADQEYFSDGFTEEMIAELGMLQPDRLVGHRPDDEHALQGREEERSVRLARSWASTYLLEGSVRRSGTRVRITAQLVDTTSMTNLWAESYERDVDDVLAIQSEVARQIAPSLALALTPGSGGGAQRARVVCRATSSTCAAAFSASRRPRKARARRSTTTSGRSRPTRKYAAAYAGIADAYRLLGAPGWEVDSPAELAVEGEGRGRARAGARPAFAGGARRRWR